MPYDTTFQRRHGRWLTWLRIATLVPPVIALCLLGYSYSMQDQIYTDGIGPASDFVSMVPLAFCFCWSLSFLIAAFVKSSNAPMHPGFAVGFDFLSFGSLIGSGVIATLFHLNPTGSCFTGSYDGPDCDVKKKMVPAQRTAEAFLYLDAIFHIILFVAACRACTILRRERNSHMPYDIELQNKARSSR